MRRLNLKFYIQQLETLPVKLMKTDNFSSFWFFIFFYFGKMFLLWGVGRREVILLELHN